MTRTHDLALTPECYSHLVVTPGKHMCNRRLELRLSMILCNVFLLGGAHMVVAVHMAAARMALMEMATL